MDFRTKLVRILRKKGKSIQGMERGRRFQTYPVARRENQKHPNAPRKGLGEPIPCISTLGYKTEDAKCCESCFKCWNRPLEE